MLNTVQSSSNAQKDLHKPNELTAAEVAQVGGGLNPQPLPPVERLPAAWLSDHWNR